MSFEGKVIIITGSTSGIGAACADYFAKEGALLALVGRNKENSKKVVDKIKAAGVKAEPLEILADVSIDAERIIDETIKKFNRLDVLINNAGFAIRGTIENTKLEDFDAVLATNVRGVLRLTQLAMPHLISSKGNVVNVSSVAGIRPVVTSLAYGMSKAALDYFTRCVALELAEKGVRVNSVNPGLIVTDFQIRVDGFNTNEYAAFLEEKGKQHPIGRAGEVSEVVTAIAFLAHDSASFVTGAILPVDGGVTLK